MILPKIAFRNIFRHKRRTILTVLTMFGGFTLSAFSIGWSDGTYNRIIDMFTRYQLGHIQIHKKGYLDRPSLYETIDDYDTVAGELASVPTVEMSAPRLYSAALASVGEKSTGARIIGIDPVRERAATSFDKKVIDGRFFSATPSREGLLGEKLAARLSARIGDEIVIVSQGADGSIANDVFTVTGVVSSGDPALDQVAVYLHIEDAQELLVLDRRIHEIAVVSANHHAIRRLASRIEGVLADPELAVDPWQVFAKSFYQAMQADVKGMWVSLFIIILVVAVGVLNTILMNVLERSREYGLLKAVGTTPLQIFGLVLIEVCVMAIISVILGSIAGYIVNDALSTRGIPMPYTFTYGGMEFSKMYTEVNLRSFLIPAVTVLVSALLVSIPPALRAARTAPASAMRTH